MQILITDAHLARSRVLQFSLWQIAAVVLGAVVALVLLSGTVYHFVFLKAAREGWPLVSAVVRLVVRDEIAQRDRVMRDNLDAMAARVGEMQAKLVKLESIGDRVSGLAGVKPDEWKPLPRTGAGGRGGPYLPLERPSLAQLSQALEGLDQATDLNIDVLTLAESRLLEKRLTALRVPSVVPVDGPVGSGFGFRLDPFTGRAALHAGLDFPADVGTRVVAAAGGLVLGAEWQGHYGHLLEIDHGNGLVTRYAHLSRALVKPGDIVRRGQPIAEVGNTGRSTGAHLHFEVLVDGVPQNPARFLSAGSDVAEVARSTRRR